MYDKGEVVKTAVQYLQSAHNGTKVALLLVRGGCVTAIINAGTAGGMDKRIKIFDTVISTQAAYYDVDDEILTEFHPWLPSIYFNADKDLLDIARSIFDKCPKFILVE